MAIYPLTVSLSLFPQIFFLLFLLLYSYVMLIQFHEGKIYFPEMVLVGWVVTIFLEELRQVRVTGKHQML